MKMNEMNLKLYLEELITDVTSSVNEYYENKLLQQTKPRLKIRLIQSWKEHKEGFEKSDDQNSRFGKLTISRKGNIKTIK